MIHCPKCKAVLLPTPNGAVCEKLTCGGLYPKMTTKDRNYCNAIHAGVQPVQRLGWDLNLFTFNGEDEWLKVKQVSSVRPVATGQRLGLDGNSLLVLEEKKK
jgi:hypothetical protein